MERFDMHWSDTVKPEYPSIVCRKYLPLIKNEINLISAPGGVGKTFAALVLALHFLHEDMTGKSTAYIWATEDTTGLMKAREMAVVNQYLSSGTDFRGDASRICYGYSHDRFTEKVGGTYRPTSYFTDAMKSLAAFDIVVFDPLLNFFGGEENDNAQARAFMTMLKQSANKYGTTFLVIHHGRKGDGAMRGATAFMDSTRLAYEFQPNPEGGIIARMTKSNYTGSSGEITLNPIPERQHFPRHDEMEANREGRERFEAQMQDIRQSYGAEEPAPF